MMADRKLAEIVLALEILLQAQKSRREEDKIDLENALRLLRELLDDKPLLLSIDPNYYLLVRLKGKGAVEGE